MDYMVKQLHSFITHPTPQPCRADGIGSHAAVDLLNVSDCYVLPVRGKTDPQHTGDTDDGKHHQKHSEGNGNPSFGTRRLGSRGVVTRVCGRDHDESLPPVSVMLNPSQ